MQSILWMPGLALAQTEIALWVTGEPGTAVVYEEIAAQYNRLHPETRIVVTKNSSDIFNPALVPALSSGEGPDLFSFGTGPGQPAALIEGGLVADLTPYYRQYGWARTLPASVIAVTASDGKLWAIGNEVETTAMVYNKDIFQKLGLSPPKTFQELADTVGKLKQAGYEIPIGLGGADRWPISHWQSMMFGRYAGPEGLQNVMFGDGRWNAPVFVAAAAKLQQMATDGFFGPNPTASGFAEVMEQVWAGKIPMTFTGSFVVPTGVKTAADRIADFGVFQIPPFENGQPEYATESIGSGWYANAASRNKDEIASFLDYVFFSPESRLTLLNNGTVPVGDLDEILAKANIPELAREFSKTADQSRANGTIYAFLDTVTPADMTTVTYDGLQALLLGQMTPQQFADDVEAVWATAKAEGKVLKPGTVPN